MVLVKRWPRNECSQCVFCSFTVFVQGHKDEETKTKRRKKRQIWVGAGAFCYVPIYGLDCGARLQIGRYLVQLVEKMLKIINSQTKLGNRDERESSSRSKAIPPPFQDCPCCFIKNLVKVFKY